jgi:hypothetical protein
MSNLAEITLTLAVNASGDATVNDTKAIFGLLYAIQYTAGTLDAGTDITISTQGGRASKVLLTNSPSASALWYPRDLVHDNAGTALTGTSGGDRALPLMDGTLRCVVAQGGISMTGYLTVYYYPGGD